MSCTLQAYAGLAKNKSPALAGLVRIYEIITAEPIIFEEHPCDNPEKAPRSVRIRRQLVKNRRNSAFRA